MEFYGSNSQIFNRCFDSFFDIFMIGSEKILKHINLKIKTIDLLQVEESKIIENLFREFKLLLDKFIQKRESFKRPS